MGVEKEKHKKKDYGGSKFWRLELGKAFMQMISYLPAFTQTYIFFVMLENVLYILLSKEDVRLYYAFIILTFHLLWISTAQNANAKPEVKEK